jgi:taurine transport system permease protein
MNKSALPKLISTFLVVAVLLLLWFVLTRGQDHHGALAFPRPALLYQTLKDQWKDILSYAGTTWYRVIIGLVLGTVTGLLAGVLMSYNKYLYYMLDPLVEILRPVPPIALTPFFILWFGLGDVSQLILIGMGCFMIIAVSAFVGINTVNPVYVKAASILGASKIQIYRTVYLPAIMPGFLAAVRVALASAFALTVAAEYLGAEGGLGYLIRNARQILHTETILLASIILGIESLITDQVIRLIFKRITKWTSTTK